MKYRINAGAIFRRSPTYALTLMCINTMDILDDYGFDETSHKKIPTEMNSITKAIYSGACWIKRAETKLQPEVPEKFSHAGQLGRT